jgi:uncharacterized protein
VTSGARQPFPDQLRGLAMLGIIVVNAPFFALSSNGFTDSSIAGPVNATVAVLVLLLAQGKFYLLFSFLFGYSSTFIIRDGSASNRRRFRRRLLGLAVVGLAHAVLFFIGDILLSYALLGCGLLLLVRRTDRAVLRTAVIIAVISVLWMVVIVLAVVADPGAVAGPDPASVALDSALAQGSFLDVARARLAILPSVLLTIGSLQWGLAFAFFAVGLVAGRRQLLARVEERRSLWRRLAIVGLLVGLPLQAVATVLQIDGGIGLRLTPEGITGIVLGFTTAPILAAGYVGLLALLSIRGSRVLTFVGESGRATLTLYIGESVVLSLLFCGWGLGLFGELGAAVVTLIAIGVWLVLELGMRLWLRHARQGPLEGLLARWTGRST